MYWLLRRQIIVIDIFSFTVATITLWCIWKSCCPHILVFYLVRLIPPWRLQCMVVWAFSHLKETWDASVGSKQQRKEREGFSDELLTSLQIFCWRYYWFRRIWSSWLPPPDSRGTIDKAVFWGEIIIANIIFCTVASIYFVVYLEKLLPSHSTLWPGETHSTLVEERCAFFTSWWHYWHYLAVFTFWYIWKTCWPCILNSDLVRLIPLWQRKCVLSSPPGGTIDFSWFVSQGHYLAVLFSAVIPPSLATSV